MTFELQQQQAAGIRMPQQGVNARHAGAGPKRTLYYI